MNVIFLDVDGVLNNTRTIFAAAKSGSSIGALDHKCIERFAKLAHASKAMIVLSSSWRFSDHLVETLSSALDNFGLKIHSKTDRDGPNRGSEIQRWLQKNMVWDRFVIIDDNSDMLPHQQYHFVKTNMNTGLLDEHIEKATEILGINKNGEILEQS